MNKEFKNSSLREEEQKAVQEFKQELYKIYGNRLLKIILYGSYARGDADYQKSDIDILLVGKDFNNPSKEIDRIIEPMASISLKYDILISVLPVTENDFLFQNTPLMLNVRKEGIEI